jgi:PAS domain S-box-containing protein
VRIAKKDGTFVDASISISPIALGNRSGHIICVSDNEQHKQIAGELNRSREQYQHLIDNINVGVFRTTVGKKSRFIEANPACVAIFGLKSREELFARPSWDMFPDTAERNTFFRKFAQDGSIKHYPLRLHHKDGKRVTVSISAVLVRDHIGKPIYCDGLIEDISDSFEHDTEQKKLIGDLQQALLFLNEPIKHSASLHLSSCSLSTPVSVAAKLMKEVGSDVLLVRGGESDYVGIITDHDIRQRVVADALPLDVPVSRIMTAPLVSVHEDALMFEGLLAMLENNISHIVIRDNSGKAVRVAGAMQFLKNQKYPLANLLRDINNAETVEQLFTIRERLPLIVQATGSGHPDVLNLTRIISAAAEAVTRKCILFAVNDLGPPPSDFVFLALGSVGREEQTLVTDQDNALVYNDVPAERQEAAERYFLALGTKVCNWLDSTGYSFCAGEVMAMTPKWCRPLSAWQDYFRQWVSTSEPADLLETKIFFDFRGVYGELELVNELRRHLHEMVRRKPMFLFHLVHNCLQFKPPLGMFKNIVVESAGEHRDMFSIKKAMTPIVDLARIYALKHEISETSTFSRLAKLEAGGHLSPEQYREMSQVYRVLLEQRFKHQLHALDEGIAPDNHIKPGDLTEMEQVLLREAMSQTASFQAKMSFDFTGSA